MEATACNDPPSPCSEWRLDQPSAPTSPSSSGDLFGSSGFESLPEGACTWLSNFCLDQPSGGALGQLPEEALSIVFAMVVDISRISCLSRVARGFSDSLKSELVWANRRVEVPFGAIEGLAPVLSTWLPAWRLASSLVVPRSKQLLAELSQQMPDLPIEVAWRFDSELKGAGVEVIKHGWSVRRVTDAEEEFVVLGDAPLLQTVSATGPAPYLEVILDDRTASMENDLINDFGIGVTAQPPSDINQLGAVADEVPLSWVVDFTKSSVVLSINNSEAAKGSGANGKHLHEGDRVGLRVTPAGTFEIFINGVLLDHLVPLPHECVPPGVNLFPVLDLYGCTARLSRTTALQPC